MPSITSKSQLKRLVAQKAISRQQKRVYKHRLDGLCANCNKEAPDGYYCLDCTRGRRKQRQAKYGHQPWERGKRGRPPNEIVMLPRTCNHTGHCTPECY